MRSTAKIFMKQGEIWHIGLDPAVGAEMKKTRPGLIINVDALGKLPLKIIAPIGHHYTGSGSDKPDYRDTVTLYLMFFAPPLPANGPHNPSAN